MTRLIAWACAVATVVWLAWLLVAPAWLAAPPVSRGAALAIAVVYRAGAHVCHQDPARSFAMGGVPLPVCARCTGLYAGAAIGAIVALAGRRRTVIGTFGRARAGLLAAAAPTAALWISEWAGGAAVGNAARFTGAVPLGAAAAWLLSRLAAGGRLADNPGASGVH
jgi:hypothetical protein